MCATASILLDNGGVGLVKGLLRRGDDGNGSIGFIHTDKLGAVGEARVLVAVLVVPDMQLRMDKR